MVEIELTEQSLLKELEKIENMADKLIEQLLVDEPDLGSSFDDFNPNRIKVVVEAAKEYESLAEHTTLIEIKTKSILDLLGELDLRKADNPEMIKRVHNDGVGGNVVDKNDIQKELIAKELSLYSGLGSEKN